MLWIYIEWSYIYIYRFLKIDRDDHQSWLDHMGAIPYVAHSTANTPHIGQGFPCQSDITWGCLTQMPSAEAKKSQSSWSTSWWTIPWRLVMCVGVRACISWNACKGIIFEMLIWTKTMKPWWHSNWINLRYLDVFTKTFTDSTSMLDCCPWSSCPSCCVFFWKGRVGYHLEQEGPLPWTH